MKILYIITQGENGGGQKHVLDLATNFAKTFLKDANADQKYEYPEIYVATGKRESSKDNWLTNECEKQGIPKENLYEIKSLVREIHIKSEFAATVELWKLLNKVKPDIVHVHSAKAGILGSIVAKVWGAKVVYTVHGYTFLEPLSQAKKYFYIAAEFVAGLFRDHTILISKRDLAAGRKYFILKDVKVNDFEYTSNYGLVYNGLSESLKENLLTRDAARQYIFEKIGKEDAGQILLGNIANLYKTKGLEYAVMMMDKIVNEDKKNYLFVVFGEGEERGLLEGLVSTYNLQHNFFLLGRTANAYTYLSGLDFFVLSSVKEGLPYCVLESLLAGTRVVATRVGGIPEVAEHADITLADPANPESLKLAVYSAMGNLNQNKTELPREFSLETMIDKVKNIYSSLTTL